MTKRRVREAFHAGSVYTVLTTFALLMTFPFLVMLFTSFKTTADSFRFPPRLLPRDNVRVEVPQADEPAPLYQIQLDGEEAELALVERSIRVGNFVDVASEQTFQLPLNEAIELTTDGEQQTTTYNGEIVPLYRITVDGAQRDVALVGRTGLGRFVDPQNPERTALANVRQSTPVERILFTGRSYREVVELHGMDRSLTNTALVTILVVLGQLTTSVFGGYAFARLRFPGRDKLFVAYLGTIMIPFAVLITPLYQLMVALGWVDHLAALIIPWIFTAYGTFLMRQFFLSIPREIEEATIIDGASRLQILRHVFLPASTPALASLATFTFLYAWNSFFWPLVVINSGNADNRVLTLALTVLGGRAADSPNLVLAGATIAVLPPMIIYIFGQRFFVENQAQSGLKG